MSCSIKLSAAALNPVNQPRQRKVGLILVKSSGYGIGATMLIPEGIYINSELNFITPIHVKSIKPCRKS
jgi:hypothetical protein